MREQLRELLACVRELLVVPTFPRHSSETTEWTVETVESREWNTELTTCSRAEAAATQISDAASAVASLLNTIYCCPLLWLIYQRKWIGYM